MVSMKSHRDIVGQAGTPETVAKVCGVSVHTVRSWMQRNRVPAEHWSALVDAKWATLEDLAAAAAERVAGRAA